jgi:hypothetical protein
MPPSERGFERQRFLSRGAPPPVQRLKLTKHHFKTQKVSTSYGKSEALIVQAREPLLSSVLHATRTLNCLKYYL